MDDKSLFLKKFEEKLKDKLSQKELSNLKSSNFEQFDETTSTDYETFRNESIPQSSHLYEKYCNIAEKLLPVTPDENTAKSIQENLEKAHLHCSVQGVMGFSLLVAILFLILGLTFLVTLSATIGFGLILLAVSSYFICQTLPSILAKRFKSKASDQVIMAVFYIVAYMRFNSNLELAVSFAANYLGPPLSLDFKKLLWELNNSKYPNLKSAFDDYLEEWREENLEFLEAIYLIESSLYESEEFRRISLLDKSLDIILQGNYEKVLHFAQELRGSVSTFNMIGIVLPILLLIILPLAASFGSPRGVWEVVIILYNIIIPVGVFYFGSTILNSKPSGATAIKTPKLKNIKQLQKYELKIGGKSVYISAKIPALVIFGVFLFIGLLPLLIHFGGTIPSDACSSSLDNTINNLFSPIGTEPFNNFQEFKYISEDTSGYCFGPYGTYPSLISLFIPLSLAFSIGYYLRFRYKNLINLRDKTKKLEKEFPTATFQLGNRVNEGISTELAFGVVAESMKGTETGEFFSKIDSNIKFNGMSVEKAIFDSEKGAIVQYPSELITSSMKIVVHAVEKGPEITAKTLIDLSRYLSEIHSGQERMKDLLAESLGSMKGQATFLAPLISGIVISIVSLITMIMGSLSNRIADTTSSVDTSSVSSFIGDGIPTYLFQSVVGIYIALLIIILIYMTSQLEQGNDPIYMKYQIGEKLISGMTKYSIIITLGIILFTFIGSNVLGSI